jgi:hypothetical protein
MSAHEVTVYTAPGCPVSHAEMEFLSQNKVEETGLVAVPH